MCRTRPMAASGAGRPIDPRLPIWNVLGPIDIHNASFFPLPWTGQRVSEACWLAQLGLGGERALTQLRLSLCYAKTKSAQPSPLDEGEGRMGMAECRSGLV